MKEKKMCFWLIALLLMGCGKQSVQETQPAGTDAEIREEDTVSAEKVYEYKKTSEGDWGISVTDGKVALTGYTGNETMIEIPSEIDGEPVREIGDGCFQNSELAAVKLPDGLEVIGDGAFYCSEKLEQVLIPESVKKIGASAFAGCEALTQIELPRGLTELGSHCFNAAGLQSVVIPDGITEIPGGAFMLCSELVSVRVPENCKVFGQQAFYQCEKLEELNLPADLEEVWNRCFTGTPWYTRYCKEQGDGYIVFGDALYGCGENPGEEMPRVRVIQPYAFLGVTTVKNLVIPDSVEEIDAYAFAECSSLNTVVIPDSVTAIGGMTFYGCGGLQKAELPNKSDILTDGMFQDCYSLSSVNIPECATRIPDGCFQSCYSLADFELPAGLTSIGEQAFAACLDIEELYLPASITEIGSNAFAFDTYSTFNCEPSARPEGWAEDWCGTEEDESVGTVNWGIVRE